MNDTTKTEPLQAGGSPLDGVVGHACRERLSELLRGLEVPPSHFWARCPPAAMFVLGATIADQARECQALRDALTELVACKDLKARVRVDDLCTYGIADAERAQAREDEYIRREPLAWDAARAALAGPNVELTRFAEGESGGAKRNES